MSFEIQDLVDVLRVFILIELDENPLSKSSLKRRIDNLCRGRFSIETKDLDETLKSMVSEGLIIDRDGYVQLTEKGIQISDEWRNLLLRDEPILEIVAGIADGSVTGLVVILSSLIAGLTSSITLIAALLSLATVAITNFSSFLLGGMTEDIADVITLQNLITYSLSDIPDVREKEKSLFVAKEMLNLLREKRGRMNILSASACGITTFISGIMPIAAYLMLPPLFNVIVSISIVGVITGLFLVHYRSTKTKIPWKITLLQTVVIMTVAIIASLILSASI